MYINSLYDNPYVHSSEDTVEHIDFTLIEKVTIGIIGTTIYLAKERLQEGI